MGFVYKGNIYAQQNPVQLKTLEIHDAVTIAAGALCRPDGEGKVTLAATGEKVAYVADIPDGVSRVGATATPVFVRLRLLRPGDLLEVAQGSIADADCQPGDTVDIATGSAALAADSNHDLTVFELNTAKNTALIVVNHLTWGAARGPIGPQGTPG